MTQASVQTLGRGLDVLEYLAEKGEARLSEVAEELRASRATAFRVLSTLRARGYVEHMRESRTYRLGFGLRALAARADGSSIVARSVPGMGELRTSTGETVNLALLRRGRIVYELVLEGFHVPRMEAVEGQDVPAHATALGKAILSQLPFEFQAALLPSEPFPALTSRTVTTRAALEKQLRIVRKRGYAEDNGEGDVGALCLAAPILDGAGEVVGAISVSGLAARIPTNNRRSIGTALREQCDRISAELVGKRTHPLGIDSRLRKDVGMMIRPGGVPRMPNQPSAKGGHD